MAQPAEYKTFLFVIKALPADDNSLEEHAKTMSVYFSVNEILGVVSFERVGHFFVCVTLERMREMSVDLARSGITIEWREVAHPNPDVPAFVFSLFERLSRELGYRIKS